MIERSRTKITLALAEEFLTDLEMQRVTGEEAIFKGLRLARLAGSNRDFIWLNREVFGYPNPPKNEIETSIAKETGRLRSSPPNTYMGPYSLLISRLDRIREEIKALPRRDPCEDYNLTLERNGLKSDVANLEVIVQRIRALLYEFALRQYLSLAFADLSASIFEKYQIAVDSSLAQSCGEVLAKLPAAFDRLAAGQHDEEAISHALTTCRRMIDAFANAVFPPTDELPADKTKNRLLVFVADRVSSQKRRTRIKQTLDNLYECLAKGVHADVSHEEARALVLQTYLLLGEIITLGEPAKDAQAAATKKESESATDGKPPE